MPPFPRSITLIRHGEKPNETDPAQPPFGIDEQGHPARTSLSPQGWQRAGALAVRLGDPQPVAPFVRPTVIFAPAYPDGLHRPGETVLPLARRLGLSVQKPAFVGQEDVLAAALLTQPGQDVLVCWEHHHLPDIVAALAGTLKLGELPLNARHWPDADFSTALLIMVQPDGSCAVTQLGEAVLDRD